jgi:hypothetical protein
LGDASFTFRTGLQDYLAASNATHLRMLSPGVRVALYAVTVGTIFAFLMGFYLLASTYAERTYDTIITVFGFGLGIYFARPARDAVARWAVRRLARDSANEDVATTVVLDATGIRWTSRGVDILIWWKAIDRIFIDRGSLYFVAGFDAYYIPALCFADDAARQATFNDALSRLSRMARSRSTP